MFVSDPLGHEAPGSRRGVVKTLREGRRVSYGPDSEAQFIADCQAFILIKANLAAEIAAAAAASCHPASSSPASARVDQLGARLQAYGRHIAAFPATSDRALQCKRAVAGLLLARQDDDPVPLCDTLLLSLLTDVESMFASSDAESTRDDDADASVHCLAQIEEVVAECVRVGVMPSSQEKELLVTEVNARVSMTRRLILDLARTPAEMAFTIHAKGRVLRRLMCVGGADVHEQRLALARSFVADIAALGPSVDIEDGALRIGGRW